MQNEEDSILDDEISDLPFLENIPAFNQEWRNNINWQVMNFDNQEDQSMLFGNEPLSIYSYKEDAIDKSTHPNLSETNKGHYFQGGFELSPRRGSFFFTPNSPKPHQFELANVLDSTYPKNTAICNSAPNKASICKKLNLEEEFEEVQEYDQISCPEPPKKGSPNRSTKNAKGLKNLSQNVYMIVSQLSITKYKEVADRLVNDITMDESISDKRKDEHNVKRRVYDALNVLIAAGLLRKEGKEVVCNDTYLCENIKGDSSQMRQKQRLQEQLQIKLKAIAQKQQKLEKLQRKKSLIEYIIGRNKQIVKNENQVLRFPLIGLMADSDATMEVYQQNIAIMKFESCPKLHGDVDLLLQINRDKIQVDNLLKNICFNEQDINLKMQEQ